MIDSRKKIYDLMVSTKIRYLTFKTLSRQSGREETFSRAKIRLLGNYIEVHETVPCADLYKTYLEEEKTVWIRSQ